MTGASGRVRIPLPPTSSSRIFAASVLFQSCKCHIVCCYCLTNCAFIPWSIVNDSYRVDSDARVGLTRRMRVLALAVASAAATALCGASGLEPTVLMMHEHPKFIPQRNDTCCHASAHLQEVLSLSELPLDRLLRVQVAMHPSTFDQITTTESPVDLRDNDELEVEDEPPEDADGEALPQPEALRSRHRSRRPLPPVQRGDLIETGSGQSLGTKQSKLATGFQLAITVLSFLAFGAYLISLVVSIVRNNNSTATTATTQQPFVLVPATAGKRKRRRADPPWIPPRLPEPEHMFDVITSVARAYAKFEGHELDN